MEDRAKDVRDRVFAHADRLFKESGEQRVPSVDQVRKAAKVAMADANTYMKEWRRLRKEQGTPEVVQVPEVVREVADRAVAMLWQHAHEAASETLRAAQAGWEAQQVELEQYNAQVSAAFDEQSQELEQANNQIQALNDELLSERERYEALNGRLADSNARAEEAAGRAHELRNALEQSKQETQRAQDELRKLRETVAQRDDVIQALRTELATVKANAAATEGAFQEYRDRLSQEVLEAEERIRAQAQEAQELRDKLAKSDAGLVHGEAERARQAEEIAKLAVSVESERQQGLQARDEANTLRGKVAALQEQIAAKKPAPSKKKTPGE